MGSSKKRKEKQTMVAEEDLRSRYKEYKGSTEHLEPQMKKREVKEYHAVSEISNFQYIGLIIMMHSHCSRHI